MRTTLVFLAALLATQVYAAPLQLNPNCADPQSNLEMKLCAKIELERADAELNKVYAETLASARENYRSMRGERGYKRMPDSEAVLRKAQRAWIVFRDANCDYQYQLYYGGSHAGLAYLLCKSDMTKSRVKELKMIMNGGEEPSPPP